MKKWIVATLSVLFLAALISVPVGCGGPGAAEKITPTGEEEQPPEHAGFKEQAKE